ncbi:hypothetical protein CB1_001616021 [Camelus ferus]|nr:hypothetical protein CB1_001616021 [Camelus ferus]
MTSSFRAQPVRHRSGGSTALGTPGARPLHIEQDKPRPPGSGLVSNTSSVFSKCVLGSDQMGPGRVHLQPLESISLLRSVAARLFAIGSFLSLGHLGRCIL